MRPRRIPPGRRDSVPVAHRLPARVSGPPGPGAPVVRSGAMESEVALGQPSYFTRALGIVAVGSSVHLGLAHAFALVLNPNAVGGTHLALALTVTITALVRLGVLYMRTQHSGAGQSPSSVSSATRVTPPIVATLLVPLTFSRDLLEAGGLTLVGAATPVITSAWAAAILVSMVEKRALHALAVRTPIEVGSSATVEAPSLAGGFARVLSGAAFAATVLILGVMVSVRASAVALAWDTATLLPAVALGLMILSAAAAGSAVGQSPGRDVVSIARRLDALGYNDRNTLEVPVVVTSFDEVGELFARLESLRERLAREATLYQEALDETRDAEAIKSEFLGAVSHELRTPLNSVCGFAQLLLEGTPDPLSEAQREDVKLIRAGGLQLLALINDILDISMIESGELNLSFTREDLGNLADEVVRIHQPLVRDKDVELRTEIGTDIPPIMCDRRRISQVVTNLVSNAIKFTEHGEIVVRATFDRRQGNAVLRVIDSGIGIAPNELGAIFEEYRQVGSIKRRKKGTGLGLGIARSLALAHGGSLTVESTLGEGSTFILSLPRTPPPRREEGFDATSASASRAWLGGDNIDGDFASSEEGLEP